MNTVIRKLLRFFLPWACAACGSALESLEDVGFCGRCWLSVPRIQGAVCWHCGVPLMNGGRTCYPCREQPSRILVRAAVEYRDLMRRAIYRFKYEGRKSMAVPLSTLLSYAWECYPELGPVQALVPIPLHAKNERSRGYNQAELLATELSFRTRVPALPQLLVRSRATQAQYRLDRTDRRENVRNAFTLNPFLTKPKPVAGLSLLLIDDICTTASTLSECALVLRRAGAVSVKALVLARDL